MKLKPILPILFLSLFVLFNSVVHAEEIKTTKSERKCEKVGELVNKRIAIFEKTKTNHAENYDKLSTKLTEIITKLNAKGFDTTKLTTDTATLSTMISEYKTKYASFVTELKATQGLACSADATITYKDKLEQSKGILQELRTMREKIRNFYTTAIREDIKALRQQAETKGTN